MEYSDLKNRNISIIGAGVSGCALACLASKHGADVFVSDAKTISDEKKELFSKNNVKWEENGNSKRMLDCDEVVVSSGISPRVPILLEAEREGVPMTGELDFVSPYMSGVVIGVTGSNGKTTTTSMIGHLLTKLGCSCMTAGNIGVPVAKAADSKHDFVVLELSSFQLYWAKKFTCDIAVVTNLAPDHIDWHGSYENYVASKANLIKSLKDGGAAIFQKRDAEALKISEKDCRAYPLYWNGVNEDRGILMNAADKMAFLCGSGSESKHKLFSFNDINLLGTHNLENAAMAVSVLALLNIGDVPREVLASYQPPEHRCAFAGCVKGVKFVDDSKGTNVAASSAAMASLPGSKIVILGGKGKGEDYSPLACAVKKHAREAVLMGSEKEKIADALKSSGYTSYIFADDMHGAVKKAYKEAHEGETVLLSPACTSWDMYKNFEERGDDFCRAVKEIAEKI